MEAFTFPSLLRERVLKLIDMNESNQEYIWRSGGEMKGDERNVKGEVRRKKFIGSKFLSDPN